MCGGTLDTIGALVDESLVRSDGERFAMLETIREYAIEALDASQDAEDVRRAHAAHYLDLARAAAPGLATADQATWRARLEADHGNLRAAIRVSLDHGDAPTALELCVFLARFWLGAATSVRAGSGSTRPSQRQRKRRRPAPARSPRAASSRTTRPTTTTRRSFAGRHSICLARSATRRALRRH